MNRREWLTRVFGTVVAATVAPLVDLTDTTPAFWNQAPIRELMRWCVQFPDGLTISFNARVVSEWMKDDGTVGFSVEPEGMTTYERWRRPPRSTVEASVMQARPTILCDDKGGRVGEVLAIEAPTKMDRIDIEALEADYDGKASIPGWRKQEPITMTLRFAPEGRINGISE